MKLRLCTTMWQNVLKETRLSTLLVKDHASRYRTMVEYFMRNAVVSRYLQKKEVKPRDIYFSVFSEC